MATTEMTVRGELPQAGRHPDKFDQRDMIDAIKQTVAKGATDAQLRMFIEVCRSTGLNPFLKGEIWYVAEKGIIMAGRDGYLRVANENPNFDGMETRVERTEAGVPIKAVCTVWRKDRGHPVIAEAFYNEYRGAGPVWSKYPSAMISKVAEVLALKRSFAINGVVSEEEIGSDAQGAGGDWVEGKARAKSLGEAKLAAAQQAQAQGRSPGDAIASTVEAEFVYEEPPATLHEDIVNYPPKEPKTPRGKPYNKYTMYKEMGKLKDRFIAIGKESEYRRVLGVHGATKRDELPDHDGGIAARMCFKEMQLLVQDLEVAAAVEADKPTPAA